jgi:hypothetical protein
MKKLIKEGKKSIDDLLDALQPYGVLPVGEVTLQGSASFVAAAVHFALLTLARLGLVAETGRDSWRRVE